MLGQLVKNFMDEQFLIGRWLQFSFWYLASQTFIALMFVDSVFGSGSLSCNISDARLADQVAVCLVTSPMLD